MNDTASKAGTINTTSQWIKHGLPAPEWSGHWEAWAVCSCGWTGTKHTSQSEGLALSVAEDDALAHRTASPACLLDETSLYKRVSS